MLNTSQKWACLPSDRVCSLRVTFIDNNDALYLYSKSTSILEFVRWTQDLLFNIFRILFIIFILFLSHNKWCTRRGHARVTSIHWHYWCSLLNTCINNIQKVPRFLSSSFDEQKDFLFKRFIFRILFIIFIIFLSDNKWCGREGAREHRNNQK
mgnify:CR=1 FL=1